LRLDPRAISRSPYPPYSAVVIVRNPSFTPIWRSAGGVRGDLKIRRSLETVLLSAIFRLRLDPRAISRSPYPPYSAVVIVRNPSFTPIWRSAGGVRADLKIRRSLETVLLSAIFRLRLDPRAISRSPYPPYSAVVIVRNLSLTPI